MTAKKWDDLTPQEKANWLDQNFDASISDKTKRDLMWRKWRYKGIPRHKRPRKSWWRH